MMPTFWIRLGILYTGLAYIFFRPVLAVDFNQCLSEIQSTKWGTTGGTDSHGNPISNISQATAITYELCKRACGTASSPFSWSVFSQQFSAWLLPWLALISQLPFGANLRLENLTSMLLTVGSPMLAAYSLALTVVNRQWIARRFSPYNYPNTRIAVRMLSSLQQAPLKITTGGLLSSLVVLEENDNWWAELATWLDYTHTWSISAATSIAWVVIAYLFTVIDSFANVTNCIGSNGQGVGSVWLWLLAVVIGWLQISPKCDSARLALALDKANHIAYVASDGGAVLAREQSELRAFSLHKHRFNALHADEENTAPIFNYARFLSWVQAVEEVSSAFRYASENVRHHRPVNPDIAWQNDARNGVPHPANRSGSLKQVEVYCSSPDYVRRSRWGPDVGSRFLVASLLSLILQWGTTGAGVVVVFFTPTIGLGCRSGAYLLYASVSTVVWAMMVTSSGLAHYSTAPHHISSNAALLSIALRRLGKLLATANAIWIVATCLFQFSGFFDRCYCNSSVLGLGSKAYDVILFVQSDIQGMRGAWIGGVVLAVSCASIYVGFVNLYMDPPLPD